MSTHFRQALGLLEIFLAIENDFWESTLYRDDNESASIFHTHSL